MGFSGRNTGAGSHSLLHVCLICLVLWEHVEIESFIDSHCIDVLIISHFKTKNEMGRGEPLDNILSMVFSLCLGTNRISYAVQGAHEGGIFALCMLRDGTLVSGGGKDRKLISWDGNYQKLHKTEVRQHVTLLILKLLCQPVSLWVWNLLLTVLKTVLIKFY